MKILNWLFENRSWLFEGAGVTLVAGLIALLVRTVNRVNRATPAHYPSLEFQKARYHILFIDDDRDFKIDSILRDGGWIHSRRLKDLRSLDESDVINANVLFVDIQGVGRKLGFIDEGLGLAQALKEKYPQKRVIIYSAVPEGDRLHPALNKVDRTLRKNAGPYEFQKTIEEYAKDADYQ